MLIATQWRQTEERLRALGHRVQVLPEGVPTAVDAAAQVLLLAPPFGWGGPGAVRPEGWPWGLRWVQLATAGFDFFPPWLMEAPVVTTARGVAAGPIAEYVIAALFDAVKRPERLWIHGRADWKLGPVAQLAGTCLGLYGFGAIAQEVARRALALGMQVRYVRRQAGSDAGFAQAERVEDLRELARRSDHLVLAAPATRENIHVVDDALLAHAKPGLHLINVARGALVDQEALLRALDSGRLSRATLDVTEPEPLPDGHPFYTHPAVRLSPHTSAVALENHERLWGKFALNLARFEDGQALIDVADAGRGY